MHIDSHVRHAPCAHHDSVRLSEAFGRAKTIFDQGESLWIPVMVLGLGYVLVVPVFIVMLVLDLAAAYLVRG